MKRSTDPMVSTEGPSPAVTLDDTSVTPAAVTPPPVKVTATHIAQAKMRLRRRRRQGSADPFRSSGDRSPFDLPLHPPGVGPAGDDEATKLRTMAADAQITSTAIWAAESAMSSAWAEGQVFLGYAELSVLAQRPEYRVISEEIASEMTREWIEFTSTDENEDKSERIHELEDELGKLGVRDAFNHAAEYDGFMGRSHLYIDTGQTDDREELVTSIGDGTNLTSRTKIKKGMIKAIRPVEAVWCYPTNYASDDPLKKDWYTPSTWFVMGKEVHHTRLLTFIGREVPDMLKPAYSFGGLSMTQMVKPYVDNWLRTRQSVSDATHSYSVSGLKTNLATLLQPGAQQSLFDRIDLFNLIRDNRGAQIVDKDTEEWFNISSPLATLDALQAQSQEHMASISRIPIVKLLGIQPAGLNASSEGEITSFYDWIHAYQEKLFRKHLQTVVHLVMLSLWDEVDEGIGWKFRPLEQQNEGEQVANEKTKADIDDQYIANGVLDPLEVRRRVVRDEDSQYNGLNLDPDALPEPPQPEEMEGMPGMEGGEPGAEMMSPEEAAAMGQGEAVPPEEAAPSVEPTMAELAGMERAGGGGPMPEQEPMQRRLPQAA